METTNVIDLPAPRELSPEQEAYWIEKLEVAERAREYALRMLGRLPIELGLTDEPA